jgi:hypothetical protein
MTVGRHSVTLYADRGSLTWTTLGANADFASGMNGWQTEPFTTTTWVADPSGTATVYSDLAPGNTNQISIERTPAAVAARPAAGDTWRIRARVTTTTPLTVFAKVFFGTTPEGASMGPTWRPNDSVQLWAATVVQAGTWDLEWAWPSTIPPQYTYVGPHLLLQLAAPDGGAVAAGRVTLDRVTLDYRITSTPPVDLSCLMDAVSIEHGRAETTGQPEAPSATMDFTTGPGAPLPAAVEVGAILVVSTTITDAAGTNPVTYPRFTGRITDMTLGWDEAGEDTPVSGIGQLVAVGILADLGRRIVGDTPWPAELDGARVARVCDLAGFTLDPYYSDPGTATLNPRDVDSQPALDVAHGAASSASGVVWQTRTGEIRYADADHRRGATPRVTLDACDVTVTPSWTRNLDGLTNEVSIGYGVPAEGQDQPRYRATDAASQGRYGRYGFTSQTELANQADAAAMGNLLLARNNRPAWILSRLPLDMAGLTADETAAVLSLEVHDLVGVTGFPAIGSAPTVTALWMEGWSETLTWGGHELELSISDYCRTSPPPRWNDLPYSYTWDKLSPAITWDSAACLGPQQDAGRWVDIPASLRWDQVPATTTWDGWVAATSTETEMEAA